MKVVSVVGARPQFIKIAPIIRAVQEHNISSPKPKIEHLIIHTGQHYDYLMNKVFFEELGIPEPDYNLEVGSGTHGWQTGEMLKRIEEVLIKEKPDMVLVYGDTNSTLAGALAASKIHIPVAHVEAGLRSFNKKMPEEINRVLTDHVSDLLFCPTETAVKNLKREGITQSVYQVGDVMYDSVLYNIQIAEKKYKILEKLNLKPKKYALATVHRAENTDDMERLGLIFRALDEIACDGLPVIVPLHPRTQKYLASLGIRLNGLKLLEPVSYFEMLLLEREARVILTDSGGVQKEAFFFRVPCVTLREETEWVETVEAGWNVLVGAKPHNIIEAVKEVKTGSHAQWPYGKGDAAKKMVNILFHTVI